MSRVINQKGGFSRHRFSTQPDDTRTQLRVLLTSIKEHKTERAAPLPRSMNLSAHLQMQQQSNMKKLSLPMLSRRKSATKIAQLNNFQKHIISNYLNAHLKFQSKGVPPAKNKSPKAKVGRLKTKKFNKNKQRLNMQEDTTIHQADFDTIRDKSQYQSIDNKKDYSLKEEPMKHYVNEKRQRKKRQWKQACPLDLETYFVTVKDKVKRVGTLPVTMKEKTSNIRISFPQQQNLTNFIKTYQPKNKDIKIVQLIKKEHFSVDFSNDNLYFGQIRAGKKEGLGVQLRSGYLFQGHWVNGSKIKGYQLTQHGVYIGGFRADKKEGRGSFTWVNGEHYEGQWVAGKRHGVGMWTSPNGDNYMGEWKKGVVEGEGVHKTSSGQRYEGGFKNFLKHGWGKQSFPNRDKYEGQYLQGLPHGAGIYIWADGTTYEGDFFQGYRQGKGILHNSQGFSFRGEFFKQKAEGHCEIDYGNGQTYSGDMKLSKRNGKGTLRNVALRKVFNGYWKDNEFVTQQELD